MVSTQYRNFISVVSGILLLAISPTLSASEYLGGEKLFTENCASCHQLGQVLTGPDLISIHEKRTPAWLISFIRNSGEMIASGDADAIKVYNEYKQVAMPAAELSDTQIKAILDYIAGYKSEKKKIDVKVTQVISSEEPAFRPRYYKGYWIVIATLAMLGLFVLIAPRPGRSRIGNNKATQAFFMNLHQLNYVVRHHVSRFFFANTVLAISIVSLFFVQATIRDIVRFNQAYGIKQPLYFSHRDHYDTYKTDCIYCHHQAATHAVANIPQVHVCMKCHQYIKEGEKYKKAEINKLLTASRQGREIKWQKGYRLLQGVHFDHSLHFISGGLTCTACHSNTARVELSRMEINMKWCLNCHKKNSVNTANTYYKSRLDTARISGLLSVSGLAGMDCHTCHY